MRKLAIWTVVALVLSVGLARAGSKANPDIKGWERGGAYDKLFDPKEADAIKGRVVKIFDIVPQPGMATGLALQVEDKKDKTMEIVHLGPKDYVDLSVIGLKEGDQIKAAGAWAELEGQDVLLAVKIKKGEDVQLKVRRTKDGFPFWSMSPEERQRESAGE
jgi:C-terminal processing protease CtpA/Prc